MWVHLMDANKTVKKLNGNYKRMLQTIFNKSLEQHHKTAAVWPSTFYLTNHPSGALLEK